MSIYEYTCKECGHRFKDVEKAEGKERACPECTNDTLEKAELNAFDSDENSCSGPKKPPFR